MRLLVVVDVVEELDPICRRGRGGESLEVLRLRPIARDHEPEVMTRWARREPSDQVIHPLGAGQPGQIEHIAVARELTPVEHLGCLLWPQTEIVSGVDGGVGDGDRCWHRSATRCRAERRSPRAEEMIKSLVYSDTATGRSLSR